MECIVSIDEAYRNLTMAFTWIPSLLTAALVFGLLMLTYQRKASGAEAVRRTVVSVASGVITLFVTWGLLLWAASYLLCST